MQSKPPANTPPSQTKPAVDPPTPQLEVGYVISTRNYLMLLNGLPSVKINELVVNENGVRAVVTSLSDNSVEALLLDEAKVQPNERFAKSNQLLSVGLGPHLLSRTVNPLGIPIDGKGRFPAPAKVSPIDRVASGIQSREFIKDPFETGITTVDMLVPLAKGQRELVMGPARSGKTGFIIDTISNQKLKNQNVSQADKDKGRWPVVCIYALIGKPLTEIKRLVDILTVNKAIEYTVVVASSASDPASLVYLTPAVALTVAEYFQQQGLDVLLILDDLGMHAKYYREISLLSNQTPGRESYPGDIFSQHAALVERAGNFNSQFGGGSITALPVIETSMNDYAAFIPTNLMSMTDGHLLFDYDLYHRGMRPGIDIALSVSRVGRQAQSIPQKQLSDKVKTVIAEAKKLEALSRFGSEVSAQTQKTLNQGRQIEEVLRQLPLQRIPKLAQMVLLSLVFTPFLMAKDDKFVAKNKPNIINFVSSLNNQELNQKLDSMKDQDELINYVTSLIPQIERVCVS